MTSRLWASLACSLWIVTFAACGGSSTPAPDGEVSGGPATATSASVDVSTPAEPDSTSMAPVASGSTATAGGAVDASDLPWPRFHGPHGDNLSTETSLLKEWPEDGPPLEWTCEGIGNGYSSISIGHGMIFTAGNIDKKTMITAISLDGKILWQVENGDAWEGSYPGTRSTPTIDDDRLYHQSPIGNVICLDAKTGKRIWTVNVLERFGAENTQWALAESVTIDGDHVLSGPGGPQTAVVALNKLTGETVWQSESTGDKTSYTTPNVIECGGMRIVLTMNAKAFIGVNADTGKLLFRHPFSTEYDIHALKPIFHNGQVFISGGYGTTGSEMLKLNVTGDSASVELVWASKELDSQHGGVILLDGYLYGAAHKFNNGKWICLDWATGDVKWAEREFKRGSLTYADGMLYLLSERNNVGLLRANPEAFELVSQFSLPPGGEGQSWAHPVVSGGRLYIRYDTLLHAYKVKAE